MEIIIFMIGTYSFNIFSIIKDINVFYLNLRLVKEIIEKDDLIVLCLYIKM